ncbi:intraflagellar transport protein 81 homolog [Gigantopelta aegis]|uniref:intraflagellar transport protein 81 homolog n=1 Tax=Gigantopelta aegis TaxID=1735272 RepID=UPI001B88C127|nr:intraflagellar transport protein 81 homolog [Gigantopelta aegis]
MEHFKEIHKAVEMERSSEYNTADVRQDIESMEEEKKQLERQLERLRRRVESFPNHEEMLDSAQKLRKERAKGLQLKKQKEDQKEQLVHVQQKLQRMSQELDEIRNTTAGLTAEVVISKIEEENKVQKMIAGESLPKKVETKRKQCIELEKVLSEPVVSELDLEVIQQQIDEVNEEIRILMEKKMAEDETGQENMTMFRQQASIIAHKRQTAAETVQTLMDEVNELEKELELKQKQLDDDLGGIELVREDEFRKYIDRLRVISNTYKMKRLSCQHSELSMASSLVLKKSSSLEMRMLRDVGVYGEETRRIWFSKHSG